MEKLKGSSNLLSKKSYFTITITIKLISVVLLLLLSLGPVYSITLHVGVGQTYTTISDAVIASTAEDTIIVHDGIYIENVDIDKSITLESLNGYETTFVTPPIDWEDIFDVTADNVTIDGFSFYGCLYGNAVHFNYTTGGLIQNCRSGWSSIEKNYVGIYIASSDSITVKNNICSFNTIAGIHIAGSNFITVSNNICNFNQRPANDASGIQMYATFDCQVHNNVCNYNDYGINYAYNNWHDTITENECQYNDEYGLYAYHQHYTNFSDNIFNNNYIAGVFLSSGYRSVFAGNKFESNVSYGFDMYYSDEITFYMNSFADNTENVHYVLAVEDDDLRYNTPTKMAYRTNAATFKNFLGNYYDDYAGVDADMDGIGDTPHVSDSLYDSYPLIDPPEDYGLLTWYLNNVEMSRNDMGIIGGLVNIPELSTHIWVANEPVMDGLTFPAGVHVDSTSWTGQIIYKFNDHPDMLVEIGIWNESSFIPGGPQVYLTGFADHYIHNYATTENSFTVPLGQYLAIRATVDNTDRDFDFHMGGTWAYISAPIGSPEYPGCPLEVPEVSIEISSTPEFTYVQLEWDEVACATSYNIYSSDDPYGTYTLEDNTTETIWFEFIEEEDIRKFYYITAVRD